MTSSTPIESAQRTQHLAAWPNIESTGGAHDVLQSADLSVRSDILDLWSFFEPSKRNGEQARTGTEYTSFRSQSNRTIPVGETDFTAEMPQTELLAEWNGFVTAIGDLYFCASLDGVFGEGVEGQKEEAEIPVSDVSRSDLDLFKLGGIFRLCVLHEVRQNGQPRRFTQVVFRRLPAYRAKEIVLAEERAEQIHQRLHVE